MKPFNTKNSSVSSHQSPSAELAKVHHANLLKNLEHRLQVARAQGDQNLIHLLERERDQLG